MFLCLGSPEYLGSVGQDTIDVSSVKKQVEIAVLDDDSFAPKDSLLANQFRINELGPDIRSLDQVASYPIIICDVGGVGRAFGSSLEGAHVVAELRKTYPDKFLIAYTGLTYSLAMTNALTAADKRMQKDAVTEAWIQTLELGINEVMNPRKRWIRMRVDLLNRGVDLYNVFKLEQAFIKSMKKKSPDILGNKVKTLEVGSEVKDLLMKFSSTALVELIGKAIEI